MEDLSPQDDRASSWADRQRAITDIAARTLFFIGGAPRSGTTWLQQILDAHPDVCCRGEGLFLNQLAVPLEAMMARRGEVLAGKNATLFRHTGGYPLPARDDVEFLAGTAILLALHQQCAGRLCLPVGEKTPENVFFFPRLSRLFPRARFIAIARDPRDVLTSAWHFFHKAAAGQDEVAAKTAFVRKALPSLGAGMRAILSFAENHPADAMVVTYEALLAADMATVTSLLRFLGVSDAPDIAAACLAQTAFTASSGGRAPGVAENGSFLRKGIAGDWPTTLTPAMNELVLQELGWSFQHFGWQV